MSTPVRTVFDSEAGVEQVVAALTAPDWPARRAAALNDGSRVLERSELPGGGVRQVVSRELPKGGPGFLDRFLPRDGRVVQTDEWGPAEDGVRRGTWTVEIPGAPARLGGTLLLEPTPAGSRYTVAGQARISLPLVGGKAERFVAEMVEKLAVKEGEVLRAALAEPV